MSQMIAARHIDTAPRPSAALGERTTCPDKSEAAAFALLKHLRSETSTCEQLATVSRYRNSDSQAGLRLMLALRHHAAKHAPTAQPAPRPLLPPPSPAHAGRATLVLDLDETLVHTELADAGPPRPDSHSLELLVDGALRRVAVALRPGVPAFLVAVSRLFELVVFTASHQSYAQAVLALLDPDGGLFAGCVCRDACTWYGAGLYVKDLTLLGRDMARVVLVDNSPAVFALHPHNGAPIPSWYRSRADRELAGLMPLLRVLAAVPDVRPVLARYFRLCERVPLRG